MLTLFEGEIVDLQKLCNNEKIDVVEVITNCSTFITSPFVYWVPTTDQLFQSVNCVFTTFKFYRFESSQKIGILKYQEFSKITVNTPICIKQTVAKIEKPCYHQIFYKNKQKYLIVKSNVADTFEMIVMNGMLCKSGIFYKILGDGPFIFKTKHILYKFI